MKPIVEPGKLVPTGLAKALLDSLALDRPTDAARRAASAALGLGGGGGGGGSAPRTPARASAALKWVAVTTLVGAGAVVAVLALRPPPVLVAPTPGPTVAAIVPAASPAVPAPPVVVDPVKPVSPPARARTVARTIAPAAPTTPSALSTLSAETALLDSARAALRHHSSTNALALLDDYGHRYPSGVLAIESSALRVEALLQAGQRDVGLALGEEFLAHHGDSALANRVRSLIATEQRRDQNEPARHSSPSLDDRRP